MLFCAGTVSAADDAIFVNGSSGLDTNDGYSWSSPKLTIQNATGTVSSNGIVNIADGVYSGYGNTDITIDRNMTIQGLSQNGTIINANYQNRIFYINPGITVILQNLTLANGNTTEFGGAIRNMMGNLTVTGCTFTNNTASNGGAIGNYAYRGTVTCTVNDSTFTNNHANTQGGAIYNSLDYWGGPLTCTVTKSTFTNNQAGYGGAIYNVNTGGGTALIITDSTFTNNQALFNGGAILNSNFGMGSLNCTVTGSTFNQNQAIYYGGALYNYNHVGSLNCVANFNRFYNNNATTSVNAIYNSGSSVDTENNWWGSNNPDFNSLLSGITHPTYWLFMTINATPTIINTTQTSLIRVSFNNHSSDGTLSSPLDPNLGHIPDGTPVTFRLVGDILGSLNEPVTMTTTNGIASKLFTASDSGIQQINATTDYQNVSAYVTINPASFVNITKEFRDLPWGNVITTAHYNDKIYAIVEVENLGPDSTESVNVQDLLDGLTWTGNYYVLRTVGSYPSNNETWEFNDPKYQFNGTDWNVGSLLTMIGRERWLAIEVTVNRTGTVSNYAEIVNQSSYPYQGYANYTAYLTANNRPTFITANDVSGNKGDTVTLNAVLTDYLGNPLSGKTVNFWIDNIPLGQNTTDSTGTALFNYIISQTPGNHTLIAVFNETGFYQGANATGKLYVPTADLYIQITSDKNNPTVGETFTLTYKLGNNGPDTADNVTITIPLPEGFVISKIEGDGNWTVTGNTITWTMTNVTVGDPNLYITGRTTTPGNYLFTASITSNTFSINSMGISSLTLNAQPTVNAATTTNTVGMQTTGTPVVPLALAVLSVLGGLVANRKKQ